MSIEATQSTLRGTALTTQESHLRRLFKPYVYRGSDRDRLTPNVVVRGEHDRWCYCAKCSRRPAHVLKAAGLPGLTYGTI